MPISELAMFQIIEENEELRASRAALYDALQHTRNVARKAVIPDADQDDALRKIADIALRAKNLVDALLIAGHVRGMEIADEEILDLAKAAGGWHCLSPEGQVRWIGARKRASVQEAKSLREHGATVLALNTKLAERTDPFSFPSDTLSSHDESSTP